jgi:hypothetical protein
MDGSGTSAAQMPVTSITIKSSNSFIRDQNCGWDGACPPLSNSSSKTGQGRPWSPRPPEGLTLSAASLRAVPPPATAAPPQTAAVPPRRLAEPVLLHAQGAPAAAPA